MNVAAALTAPAGRAGMRPAQGVTVLAAIAAVGALLAASVTGPLFAALIISHLGGYRVLFIIGGCCGIAGAIAVLPVHSVR
jgi:MFS family permease